jgi:hypothetical protein
MIQKKTTLMLAMAFIVSMMAIPASAADGPHPSCGENANVANCALYVVQECGGTAVDCVQSGFDAAQFAIGEGEVAYDDVACFVIEQLNGQCPTLFLTTR